MNQATESQAIHPLPPDADPYALAPVDQNAPEHQKLAEDPDFVTFLNKIGDYATAQANSPAQWERRRKSVKLRKYILGEYCGVFDRSRGWVSAKEEGDGIYYSPETATFIDNLIKDLIKTKPQKKCEPRDKERIDMREAARVAEQLLQIDDDQDSTPKRQQREWKWNLLGAGETYRITYFNPQKQGCGVTKEVYEPMEIKGGETAHFCPLCNATNAAENGTCAKCGNPQMDEFQAMGTTVTVKKGTQYQQVGDTDYDVPDALEMTVIGETDAIGEALIVMRDRMIPRCVLEHALGKQGLPRTGTPDILHYKNLFDGDDSSQHLEAFEPLHYQEFWVAPAVVASYKFPAKTPLKGGTVIDKETKGAQVFPNGFYFSRISREICSLFPQSAGECLSHAANAVGEGFHGQGEWDLIELQDQATEAKSMKMNSMLLDSTQPLMVRKGHVNADDFENKFGLIVEVEPTYGLEHPLPNLMARVPAGIPPTDAYTLGEEIKGQMQQRVGAFSTQSDAPDIKAMGTATGIAAITEQTLGRRAPALQLYAQMEVDQAYQKLEMRQKYWCEKMYGSVAQDLGTDAVKWFMQCNIRQDINISVVPNSWMPRTQTQKEIGLQTFLQLAGEMIALKGDPKMIDELIRQTNDVFGGGLNFNDFEKESIEAQLRLDKLQEVGAFVESQYGEFIYDELGNIADEPIMVAYAQTAELLRIVHTSDDPRDIFGAIPLDVMFDLHTEFEEAYTDWLKSAEGRKASMFIRSLIHSLAEYHIQADAFRLMKLNEYSKIPQIPDLQAELAINDAMAQQGLEQQAAQNTQNLELEAAQGDMNLENQAKSTEQQMLYQGIQNQLMPPEEGQQGQTP